MNKDCPKIVSDEALYKKVFVYDSSVADNRFFRQRIVDFLNGNTDGKTFSKFMWAAVWERNDGGKTIKYLDFNEHSHRLDFKPHFYEWMVRTIRKAETELQTLKTGI